VNSTGHMRQSQWSLNGHKEKNAKTADQKPTYFPERTFSSRDKCAGEKSGTIGKYTFCVYYWGENPDHRVCTVLPYLQRDTRHVQCR
jgi:hypothetical protein